jgi:hypothetical protein
MGTRFEFKTQQAYDFAVDAIFQESSFREWQDAEKDIDDGGWSIMLEKLGFLFDFLASSNNPRAMAMRVWCVLYAVRPDLINHETTQAAADRFEVSEQRVSGLLAEMKKRTGITYRSRTGMTDIETQRRRIDAMHAAKRANRAARFAGRTTEGVS